MSAIAWLWHELVRQRGSTVHRFYRVGRSSRSGVALLLVITCFLFLTIVATEITSTASVRVKMAANRRDEAQAQYLARSGLEFYRLILVMSAAMDSRTNGLPPEIGQLLKSMGISGDMLWQMVPFINTNLLRMVFVAGGDLDEDERAEMEQRGLTEEERERSEDGSGSKPGFLEFEGDFFAEVSDETRKINVKNIQGTDVAALQTDPIAMQLLALMRGQHTCEAIRAGRAASIDDTSDNMRFLLDRDLDPLELVGNLADWVDKDSQRAYLGGNEDALYERLSEPYRAKNANFDSLEEVRLVEGWHRDDVWEKFGEHLTVFGDGKINVNTAPCEVMWGLLKSYTNPPANDFQVDQCVRAIEWYRGIVPFSDARAFTDGLRNGFTIPPAMAAQTGQPPGQCQLVPVTQMSRVITTKTKVFRVQSVGQVNDAKVRVEAVFDFSSSPEGKILFWRID